MRGSNSNIKDKGSVKFATKNRGTFLPTNQARFVNDVTAVILFALATILVGMLYSYSGADDCWFKVSNSGVSHNFFGYVGAYISDMIFSMFGYSGWWLAFGVFYLGYRKIVRTNLNTSSWYSIAQVVSFLVLLLFSALFEYIALYFVQTTELHNGHGGIFGHLMFYMLAPFLGQTVLVALSLLLVVICFGLSFSSTILVIAEIIGFVVEKFTQGISFLVTKREDPESYNKENHAEQTNHHTEHTEDDSLSIFDEEPAPKKVQTLTRPEPVRKVEIIENKFENTNDLIIENDFILDEEPVVQKDLDTPKPVVPPYFDLPDDEEIKEEEIVVEQPRIVKPVEIERPIIKPVVKPIARPIIRSNGDGSLPSTSLLTDPISHGDVISQESIDFISTSIENKLAEFGVEAQIVNAESGPVITRYELVPSRGVRGDKIVGLGKEIARGLALTNVRIVETIPGKNSMGIEVPNFKRQIIYLKEIFDSPIYHQSSSKLTLALGKDIAGSVVVTDLAKMPHLLVAGTTGSGKSVAVNAMILSILFQATPDEVKFIMIDPKMVELSFYQDIPHLLAPVVTDMTQAGNALKWTVGEMERRYKIMARVGCKNIISFNQKMAEANERGEPIYNPLTLNQEEPEPLNKWAYIVVIIDELADLMMVTGKKTEQYIARIAQKARAVGIHLIVATQRPSVDVITGLIKANIPARISFQVSSKIDSRTVLDQMGAETLLGQGDMLFLPPGSGFPQRIHGAYVNDDELNAVVEYLKSTGKPDYIEEILTGEIEGGDILGIDGGASEGNNERDQLYDQVVKLIYDTKRCSISHIQTMLRVGYNRAASIMMQLERDGLVRRNERGGYEMVHSKVE